MFVTVAEDVIRQLQQKASSSSPSDFVHPLYGRALDDHSVVQVLSLDEGDLLQVGYCVYAEAPPSSLLEDTREGEICLCLNDVLEPKVSVFGRTEEGWETLDYDIIRLKADFHSRLQGLFDTSYLFDKTVTVIGLGTGGGLVSLELAKNGVGHFRLVDFDRLEVHNIARHVCGLSDLGRYKTRAVADLIRDNHPNIAVEFHEFDILEDEKRLENIVTGSDLVIAATDSERSKRLINQVCWPLNIPVIYGAAYDRAFGGDVIRVVPPDSACYECVFIQLAELFETVPKKSDIDYAAEDISKVVAEPGLGIDVAFIGLIIAKMALLTLLRDTDSTLKDFPVDWIMWGNQIAWVFEKPLESIFLDVPRNPTCPVCRYEAYVAAELEMTVEEAEAAGKAILDNIPQVDGDLKLPSIND